MPRNAITKPNTSYNYYILIKTNFSVIKNWSYIYTYPEKDASFFYFIKMLKICYLFLNKVLYKNVDKNLK